MRLGIDIGGTTLNLGLVRNGRLIEKKTCPSFPKDATLEQTLDYLGEVIDGVMKPEVCSIGIGVPTVVDTEKGIVYDAMNIPSWKEVHLKDELERRYGIPVHLNNDSNCYALGAYSAVADRKPQMMLCITLGTGVGVGVVYKGGIVNGSNTGVGELSCLSYMDSNFDTYCSSQFFKSKGLSPKEVARQAEQGNESAIALYDEFAGHLGHFIAICLYAYDPDIIVLGGGLANSFDLYKDKLMESIDGNFIYKKSLEKLEILAMPSGETAIVGAANL